VLFPTAEYGLFFLLVFAASWALASRHRAHKALLLAASWFFYGFWDWRYLPLLAGISLLAAGVGRALQVVRAPGLRRALLAGGVAVSLGVLGFFKYAGFAAALVVELLGAPRGPVALPELALPVGISFFVFHAISLMVDAWRGRIPVPVTALDALLYVAFFPQLVAGPILRAGSFLPQLASPPDPKAIDAARAFELIVLGLAKKVVVANYLAVQLVDPVFDSPGLHGGLGALLAVYGYAAQIYCDFSGYTDIAIGSALLLGYRFPENFRSPYLASSPQDFWRRWHVSLSTWLRDYLFIPLGGSHGGRVRTLFNLALTMVLGGLWHGAAWTFVAWGALHGAALVVHRLWSGSQAGWIRAVRGWRGWPVAARLLTFHLVCAGWILFRAPTFGAAGELFAALGSGFAVGPWLTLPLLLALAAGLAGQAVPAAWRDALRARLAAWPLAAQGALVAAAVLLIEILGPQGVAPFIYFQF
jgi:D-alanyl-lipoteichoic acid acyltransferase DltB (MBOAT superfamily)